MASLARVVTESNLQRFADERSFDRGEAYFRSGAVERLISRKDRISARVVGTDVYAVKLWPEGRGLGWTCTCPIGQDGEFCKHVVATGLAWIAAGSGREQTQDTPELEVVRRFPEASETPALVEMLMDYAYEDDELAAQLLLAAERQGVSDPRALKSTIRKALAPREFVDYDRA